MGLPVNEILVGDALEQLRKLPADSVHCVVTSPPYFRLRDYGVPGQIGLEASAEAYLDRLVQVFHELKRVLRHDGTLWLNMGDGYIGSWRGGDPKAAKKWDEAEKKGLAKFAPKAGLLGLPSKSLIGMPWRLALSLQADGWLLRQDNIWHKKNVMPESVRDRSTRAHEYIFHFAQGESYFYDCVAIEEPQSDHERSRRLGDQQKGLATVYRLRRDEEHGQVKPGRNGAARSAQARQALALKGTRNKRSVWSIGTQPSKVKHFASFPEKLVEPCILAGTSEKGCCTWCGAQVKRMVSRVSHGDWNRQRAEASVVGHDSSGGLGNEKWYRQYEPPKTVGWRRSCSCRFGGTEPSVVLDPFMGAGTTALVAAKLGRRYVGIELNPEYAEMARRRVAQHGPQVAGGWRRERSGLNGRS